MSVVDWDLWQAVEILAINLRKGSTDLAFQAGSLIGLKNILSGDVSLENP